jgi:hypothetical protein
VSPVGIPPPSSDRSLFPNPKGPAWLDTPPFDVQIQTLDDMELAVKTFLKIVEANQGIVAMIHNWDFLAVYYSLVLHVASVLFEK